MQKVHKRRWCRGVRLYCRSPAREPGAAMRPTIEPPASTWFPPPPSRTRTRRSTSLGGYPAVYARAFAPNGPVLYWDIGTNGTEVSCVCYYRNYTIKLPCLTPKAPMSSTGPN